MLLAFKLSSTFLHNAATSPTKLALHAMWLQNAHHKWQKRAASHCSVLLLEAADGQSATYDRQSVCVCFVQGWVSVRRQSYMRPARQASRLYSQPPPSPALASPSAFRSAPAPVYCCLDLGRRSV
ncbi:hypothetical protein C8Q74DRAFT_800001 [Fomes fomentarius]|nr:hypothetical protein C8Q74DRAFT_800001 [Fomes fomentarius]